MSTEFQDIIPSGLQFLFHIMRLLGHDICVICQIYNNMQ